MSDGEDERPSEDVSVEESNKEPLLSLMHEFHGHTRKIIGAIPMDGVECGDDDLHVLSASADKTLAVWRLSDGIRMATYKFKLTPSSISWDASNRRVAVGFENGMVKLLIQRTKNIFEELFEYRAHSSVVQDIFIDSVRNFILSVSKDKYLGLYEIETLQGKRSKITSSFLTSLVVDVERALCYIGAYNQHIYVYKYEKAIERLAVMKSSRYLYPVTTSAKSPYPHFSDLSGHSGSIRSLFLGSNSHSLVSGAFDGSICIWEVPDESKGGVLFMKFLSSGGAVDCVDVVFDGTILTSNKSPRISVWNLNKGKLVDQIFAHKDAVISCRHSAGSKFLVTSGKDKSIKVWSILKENDEGGDDPDNCLNDIMKLPSP